MTTTLNELATELDNWLQEENLPVMTEDELSFQYISNNESVTTVEQKEWIGNLLVRWSAAKEGK